eukprot:1062288-Prymnesium_polylepis.1
MWALRRPPRSRNDRGGRAALTHGYRYPWAASATDRRADAARHEEARETPRAGVRSGERGRVNGQPGSAGPRNDVRGSPFGLGLGK